VGITLPPAPRTEQLAAAKKSASDVILHVFRRTSRSRWSRGKCCRSWSSASCSASPWRCSPKPKRSPMLHRAAGIASSHFGGALRARRIPAKDYDPVQLRRGGEEPGTVPARLISALDDDGAQPFEGLGALPICAVGEDKLRSLGGEQFSRSGAHAASPSSSNFLNISTPVTTFFCVARIPRFRFPRPPSPCRAQSAP